MRFFFLSVYDKNGVKTHLGDVSDKKKTAYVITRINHKLELLFLNGTNRSAGPTEAFKLALYMKRSILYSSALTAHKRF